MRSLFLPTRKRGEVAPSYGDGGVMSRQTIHDPSVRCADTFHALRGEEKSKP